VPHATTASPEFVRDLRAVVRGDVRVDAGSRAAYSTDASNYRQVPLGVVLPRDADDVIATIAACRKHGVPITSRGGGTSLAGQACNVGLILDHSKYFNRVLAVDSLARTARVEPGCVLDTLRNAAAPHGLTFGPDPATHNRNTLGGMIGNNSCGVHSVMSQFYGPGPLTRHQVIELDIVTYGGERMTTGATSPDMFAQIIAAGGTRAGIYAALARLRDRYAAILRTGFPDIPRRVSGYNLDALLPEHGSNIAHALVGTEGTCVTVLGATVQLMDALPHRSLVVLGYPDVFCAADHVPAIMAHRPVGLEGMDQLLIDTIRQSATDHDALRLLPPGNGWLMVEFGSADPSDADAQAERLLADLARVPDAPSMRRCVNAQEMRQLWHIREGALGAAARTKGLGATYEGWEDAAVAPDKLGAYLRAFRVLLCEFGYHTVMYGHFGQGCVHCRIDFDLQSEAGVATWMRFLDRATALVVAHGGSISGEHGDGQARGMLLEKMYGPELVKAFGEFKRIWDPENRMNPGKVVEPRRPDQDLRVLTPDRAAAAHDNAFAYVDDGGSFARATARCAGVGACRRESGGTMCPSYMATREEQHSTRGRARLLYEMVQGDVITDGWRSDAVRSALDLCLACKGCKTECPVGVDMATYKAEFLSHYYRHRVRPRAAYTMGLIYWWARAASPVAPVANLLTRTPGVRGLVKFASGVSHQRTIPTLASPTFRKWFKRRGPVPAGGNRVILWPDTFTNFLSPGPGRAAVGVLERAGFAVELPSRPLCCGRPLYDWGMIDLARRLWRQTLDTLRPAIRAGVPIVGLEPSCVAAFRDELPALFPHDEDARRLSQQTVMLGDFLDQRGIAVPPLTRRAVVHGHCHHKTVLNLKGDLAVMDRMGMEYELLDSGCCGMAGAFGFERDKYQVSRQIGERVLLPAVRAAAPDTLIIANGFSCREQITQLTGRQAVHLAEVIEMADDIL
jgi:FAD/FMN-containing dehydrogenase/Fe-S oxidoreductase